MIKPLLRGNPATIYCYECRACYATQDRCPVGITFQAELVVAGRVTDYDRFIRNGGLKCIRCGNCQSYCVQYLPLPVMFGAMQEETRAAIAKGRVPRYALETSNERRPCGKGNSLMTWSKLLHDPVGFLWDAVRNRGVRLTIYLIVVAVVFPSSRAILTAVLVLTLAVLWIRDYQKFGSRKIYYLAVCLGLFVAGYCAAWLDVKRVNELRLARSPWGEGINLVQNGTYTGSGEGFRGPIEVKVEVRDHRIAGVTMVAYPDLISVKDTEIRNLQSKILETGQLVRPGEPAMLRGAQQTLTGYTTAIESALTKGIPDYPHYKPLFPGGPGRDVGQRPQSRDTQFSGHSLRGIPGIRVCAAIDAHSGNGTLHQLLQTAPPAWEHVP